MFSTWLPLSLSPDTEHEWLVDVAHRQRLFQLFASRLGQVCSPQALTTSTAKGPVLDAIGVGAKTLRKQGEHTSHYHTSFLCIKNNQMSIKEQPLGSLALFCYSFAWNRCVLNINHTEHGHLLNLGVRR